MLFSQIISGYREQDVIPIFRSNSRTEYVRFCEDCFEFFPDYKIKIATCISCGKPVLFVNGELVWPELPSIPPSEYMPDDVRAAYMEAQAVISRSPRCACAMLRLALERLCVHLEGKGNNLRAKVLSLKLSPEVEKLCDACRLVGNDAVHEGILFVDDTDTYEVARTLSMFINWITERTIRSEALADELLAMAGKKD